MRLLALVLPISMWGTAHAAAIQGRVTRGGKPAPHIAVLVETATPAPPPPSMIAKLDEVELTFLPKVQVLPVGSSLRVRNVDHEAHTVHGALAGRTLFNRATVPGGNEAILPLDAPGVVAITCDLHSYMRAWVIVSPAAHHAVTNSDGVYRLDGIPAGPAKIRLVDPEQRSHGAEPGEIFATPTITTQDQTLDFTLRDRNQRPAAESYVAEGGGRDEEPGSHRDVDAPRRRRPAVPTWWFGISLEKSWPTSQLWILSLSALGIVLGVLAAIGNLALARRRGWSLFGVILTASGLIFLLGISFLCGLHPAVAAGLGFGAFVGTVVFAAGNREPPPVSKEP
jgi:plastocyanin